jgi:hypothetical protein
MLLPRFSIRTLLMMLTAGAVACLIAGMAYQGKYWALGVTIALASVVVTACVHAILFFMIWVFARLTGGQQQTGQHPPGK